MLGEEYTLEYLPLFDEDLSAANGVLAVAAGDNLASLAPMALPAANVTYNAGAATILIPSSTGSFVQALIRVATPPASLPARP